MTDNVVALPGAAVPARDVPIEEIVDSLVENHGALIDIVVVGKCHDGSLEIWSHSGDLEKVLGLLQRGMMRFANVNGIENVSD